MNRPPIAVPVLPKDVDSSAVSIIVDEDIHRPLGTGFYFLQPEYFVTAKHVVVNPHTGAIRPNLVLMQNGPAYPRVQVAFLHPWLDVAVLKVVTPGCQVPLYPSDQRLVGQHGLRYWGYSPTLSDKTNHRYFVAVVDIPNYECEAPRERADGTEWVLRFNTDFSEGGHSGGPVLGAGGGVVAFITEGHEGWVRATEIRALLPFVSFVFPPAG